MIIPVHVPCTFARVLGAALAPLAFMAGCGSIADPLTSVDARPATTLDEVASDTRLASTPDAARPDATPFIAADAAKPDVGVDASTVKTAAECSSIAESLAKKAQILGACTAVVRLDSATLKILGHTFVCGKYAQPDEKTARATATADVVIPSARPMGDGTLISGSAPQDEWVFYLSPLDYGGVTAVSAATGRTVFAASIIWSGMGKVMIPATWDTSDLGEGCAKPSGASVRGFEVESRVDDMFQPETIANVVLTTALPESFQRWGSVFNVLVLRYAAGVGYSTPTSTTSKPEYFVLLNGGWLE